MSQIGNNVRRLREKRMLTVRELAKRAGVSHSMISRIERGEQSPSAAKLLLIANALNTDLNTLTATK